MAALAGRHAQLRLLPVQVVQLHGSDLTCAQTVAHEQKQQRVVSLADGRTAIHGFEHALDIGPRDRSWQGRLLIAASPGYRPAEVRRNEPLSVDVAQEDAQSAGAP